MKNLREVRPQEILDFLKNVDKKTWIKGGAAAGGAVLVLALVVWPAWFQRVSLHGRIRALKAQMATSDALFRKKPELLRQKQEFMQFIEQAKRRVYEPGQTSLLLGVVSKMAQETKVSIVASEPKPYEGKLPEPYAQKLEAKVFSFTVEGGYHELGQFISRIESSQKILKVDWFELKPQKENPRHLAAMSLTALSFKKGAAG